MAACSVYVSYPSQFSNDVMDGNSYVPDIRDELVFHPSQCTPPESAGNDLTSERRSTMLQDYFKSASALSRSIILEKCTVEQQHSKQWTVLSDSKRDEIVDQYFVPHGVREQYEAGLVASDPHWRSASRGSLDRFHYSSQESFLDRSDDYIDAGMTSLSQPRPNDKTRSLGGHNLRSNSAAQLLDNTTTKNSSFQKSKLRSFSIRSKKKANKQKDGTQPQNEILPLFNRDVYELDNEVDLPDESLLTDHIAAVEDDSFARLKPLRYSFGRKMRNKISHSPDQTSDMTSEGFIISNNGVDYLDSSMQDLTQTPSSHDILYSSSRSMSTQDLSSMERDGSHSVDPTSPIHMMSDDAMSILSASRPGTRTPDSSLPMRVSPQRNRLMIKGEPKHPLSRSVRAGSSYMTVTSSFADSRRQMFKKKKTNSTSPTRESTPIHSPATSPPPLYEGVPVATIKQHLPLKQHNSVIPIVKTESVNESVVTDFTNSSSDLPSPLCSPPSSPAGLCPGNNGNTGRSKRESGYISSTYPEEMSDDEEGSRNKSGMKRKPKRRSRMMQVERTESFNN